MSFRAALMFAVVLLLSLRPLSRIVGEGNSSMLSLRRPEVDGLLEGKSSLVALSAGNG